MKTNLIFATIGSLLILSCGQGNKEKQTTTQAEKIVYEEVNLDSLMVNAENYIDKNVVFVGTVTHVCKHGGQKMFAFASSDEETMKITTGENYSEFQVELEGSTVKIEGIVREQRIDETYLTEWQTEIENMEVEETEIQEGEHFGEGMGDHERKAADMEKIQKLRAEIEASEKGYLSNYSVECVKYEVIQEAEEEITEEPAAE